MKIGRHFGDTPHKQSPPGDMEFEAFIELWDGDIRKLTSRYGWYFRTGSSYEWHEDHDDVRQELSLLLYKAWETWKPSHGHFGKYYWSMVRNKLTDQTRKLTADKRAAAVYPLLVEDETLYGDAFQVDDLLIISMPCKGLHPRERELWHDMISGEHQPEELRKKYGWRTYKKLTEAWRDHLRKTIGGMTSG